jgi:hypothetical protein
MEFWEVLSMGEDVYDNKYVRLSLRLLGTELMRIPRIGISYEMTVAKNILPLYKALKDLEHKLKYYRYDQTGIISTLLMYTILKAKYKDLDTRIERTNNIVYPYLVINEFEQRHVDTVICTVDQLFSKYKNMLDEVAEYLPESIYDPGVDIDLMLLEYYNRYEDEDKDTSNMEYDRLVIMLHKMYRVATVIFRDIPPCISKNKKGMFDFKKDIDFVFQ